MSGIDQDRSTARFPTDERIEGTLTAGGMALSVTVRDLSVTGAQIEHATPLRPSLRGRLSAGKVDAPAVVIWTRMSEPGVYRSGLRLEEKLDVIAAQIRAMLADGSIHKGESTLREREAARQRREETRLKLVAGVSGGAVPIGLPRDAILMIRSAREWFLAHPHDAVKWYQRAKMTATEDMLQIAASGRLNREDVLAVWEYLERRFDLRDVVRALD